MLDIYLRTIIAILATYCIGFNLLSIFIKKLHSNKWIVIIKRLYVIFWILPFNFYIYSLINASIPIQYFIRNIMAGILLHYLMAYMGYKATLE